MIQSQMLHRCAWTRSFMKDLSRSFMKDLSRSFMKAQLPLQTEGWQVIFGCCNTEGMSGVE